MVKKRLVEGKGYVKGTHLNPELRKKRAPYGVRGAREVQEARPFEA